MFCLSLEKYKYLCDFLSADMGGLRFEFKKVVTVKEAINILKKVSDKTGLELKLENENTLEYAPDKQSPEKLKNYDEKYHGTFSKGGYNLELSISFDLLRNGRNESGNLTFMHLFLGDITVYPYDIDQRYKGDKERLFVRTELAGKYYLKLYEELDKRLKRC